MSPRLPLAQAQLYTAVDGGDGLDVRLTMLDGNLSRRFAAPGAVLMDLRGASFREGLNVRIPGSWRVSVTHPTAWDVEHSNVYLADVELGALTVQTIYDNARHVGFAVVLARPRAYAIGVDPLAARDDDRDYRPGVCTMCPEPHPYGPYMPPDDERWDRVVGRFVQVDYGPRGTLDPAN